MQYICSSRPRGLAILLPNTASERTISIKTTNILTVFADIINLSEEGICLQSPLKLSKKDRIIICLPTLEEKNPLEIHGAVIWIRQAGPLMYEYGMKFIGVNKLMESNIRSKIKAVLKAYYDQKAAYLE